MSTYTPPSQITQRQLDYFKDKKVLMAGEVEDDFCVELAKHCQSVAIFTTHFGYYQQFQKHPDVDSYFGACLEEALTQDTLTQDALIQDASIQDVLTQNTNNKNAQAIDADLLLFYWPKSKPEAKYLLAMLMAALGKGCEIVVVGENRSGVKSIESFFEPYGVVKKYDSARRCSFYWGECTETPAHFNIEDWYKEFNIEINNTNDKFCEDKPGENKTDSKHSQLESSNQVITLKVKSLPGVFSHGELDLGTQLLLENLPELSGNILDVGCGAGVIGSVIALKNPQAKITMCDVSALALASSKATLVENNLSANVVASDVYSHVILNDNERYNTIVTNPPFHSGLETNYSAAQNLITQAPTHLVDNGSLLLVANRFLKYPDLLERNFDQFHTLAKNNKFSLYHSH